MAGNSVNMWQTVAVNRGQRLSFLGRSEGLRALPYCRGATRCSLFSGESVHLCFLEERWFPGEKTPAGGHPEIFSLSSRNAHRNRSQRICVAAYSSAWHVHIIYGLQFESFTGSSLKLFESTSWTVTSESDRMGIRLKGQTLEFNQNVHPNARQIGGGEPSNITTEGNPLGSIQVPGGAQLIIIGPDGPCEGGYAKLGDHHYRQISPSCGQISPARSSPV